MSHYDRVGINRVWICSLIGIVREKTHPTTTAAGLNPSLTAHIDMPKKPFVSLRAWQDQSALSGGGAVIERDDVLCLGEEKPAFDHQAKGERDGGDPTGENR